MLCLFMGSAFAVTLKNVLYAHFRNFKKITAHFSLVRFTALSLKCLTASPTSLTSSLHLIFTASLQERKSLF